MFLLISTPLATPQQVSSSLTITFLLKVSACNCMKARFAVIPPSTKIYFTWSNSSIFMLSYNLNVIDSRMENKMFSLETLKFKPENVPLTPDFQKGENIEPNEG
jgi:hypothetical protein